MSSIVYRAHFFINKSGYPLINSVALIAGCNNDNKTVKIQVHSMAFQRELRTQQKRGEEG